MIAIPAAPVASLPAPVRALLLVSIVAGLAYPLLDGRFGLVADILLKGLGVGALAAAAVLLPAAGGRWLAAILAAGAIGDMMLEVPGGFMVGAGAFAIGHVVAMVFYGGRRRTPVPIGDRLAAAGLIGYGLAMPALVMPAGVPVGALMLYSVLLCGMAAALLLSDLPRLALVGALLFIVSDTFLIMRMGGTHVGGVSVHGLIVWYSYYAGQLLIALGVAAGLRTAADG